mgnify:CR=1 FL=1
MDNIIREALSRYPIGGTYTVNQKIPYKGFGDIYSFSPKTIEDYVFRSDNLSICGIGVYSFVYKIWDKEPINVEPIYEIY